MNKNLFRKRLNKATRILVQELMDGCLECRRRKILCDEHTDVLIEAMTNPKQSKYLQEILFGKKK